jgi:DNA processing protein
MTAPGACGKCLARSWLLARLGGHLELVRARIGSLLALEDEQLIAAIGGSQASSIRLELRRLDTEGLRQEYSGAGLEVLCRCADAYPAQLRALASAPAVLHVAGGLDRFLALARQDPVAIVGAREPSPYGLEVAQSLGRGLARTGVTVVSGMARGIDSAAHGGALAADAPTIAVLPGSADRPYPSSRRSLHRKITAIGAAVSELGPGAAVWRWTFPARNRLIAALAAITVVVEAGSQSGALVTAAAASELGRAVGAVPGRVTSRHAAGPNELLAAGASVIRGPQDVLDQLFGAGVRSAEDDRAPLAPELRAILAAIGQGRDTVAALARGGFATEQTLAAVASLELGGYLRRGAGGRLVPVL